MKRVLAVTYSQTGQLTDCLDSLLAPLRADPEVQVDTLVLEPEGVYPFPWGMRAFLGVFPECVLAEPQPLRPLRVRPAGGGEPVPLDAGTKYDLVVFGYSVWYLSPAPPFVAFLRSPQAEVLRGVPTVVLCACRNMWQRAWVELKKLFAERGARVIDHLVLVDQGPAWSTFYTTPRWLIAGRKTGGPFPPAGVSAEAIAALARPGGMLLEALKAGRLDRSVLAGSEVKALQVQERFLIPELGAKAFFRVWARIIKKVGTAVPALRYPIGLTWFCWLLSVLPLIPGCVLVGLLSKVFAPGWHRARIAELSEPSGGKT